MSFVHVNWIMGGENFHHFFDKKIEKNLEDLIN
jgi:hypothetical protein